MEIKSRAFILIATIICLVIIFFSPAGKFFLAAISNVNVFVPASQGGVGGSGYETLFNPIVIAPVVPPKSEVVPQVPPEEQPEDIEPPIVAQVPTEETRDKSGIQPVTSPDVLQPTTQPKEDTSKILPTPQVEITVIKKFNLYSLLSWNVILIIILFCFIIWFIFLIFTKKKKRKRKNYK